MTCHRHSLAVKQAIAEKTVNGNLVDFIDGGFDGILDPAVGNRTGFIVPDDVARPLIVVARLADRTDVDHGLESRFNRINHVDFGRCEKSAVFSEHAGDMGVPLERAMWHDGEESVHFPFVEDVFLKNVFIQRIARAAMNEEKVVHTIGTRQGTEKIPTGVGLGIAEILKLIACPENGLFRPDIETFRVEKRCLIVVSEQTNLCFFHHKVDALQRIGSVTDRITEAENFVNPMRFDVFQHRVKGFEIAVNVTDDGTSQWNTTFVSGAYRQVEIYWITLLLCVFRTILSRIKKPDTYNY